MTQKPTSPTQFLISDDDSDDSLKIEDMKNSNSKVSLEESQNFTKFHQLQLARTLERRRFDMECYNITYKLKH